MGEEIAVIYAPTFRLRSFLNSKLVEWRSCNIAPVYMYS